MQKNDTENLTVGMCRWEKDFSKSVGFAPAYPSLGQADYEP